MFPEPARATATHPGIELPPSVKLTLPVGLDPLTEAVNVVFAPTVDGLSELASTERRGRTAAELSESLRQYLYAKYVYRALSAVATVRDRPVRLALGPEQPEQELAEGGR